MSDPDNPSAEHAAAATGEPVTRLDAVWRAAQDAADGPDDAGASRFLDALLAQGLICPTTQAAEGGAEAAPLILEVEGGRRLCLFDTAERLADSAVGAAEFIAAPGHVFFAAAAQVGAEVALNPGVAATDTVFSAETVAMIAALADAAEKEMVVGADETVEIVSPAPPSEAMLAALAARLAAAAEALGGRLRGAWLVEVARRALSDEAQGDEAEGDGAAGDGAAGAGARDDEAVDAAAAACGSTRLTLALAIAEDAEAESAEFGALARDLSRLGAVLAPERGLDVALLQEGERALAAAQSVGLGLLEPAPQA